MRLKPKPYGPITVFYDGNDAILFARGEIHDSQEASACPPTDSPVEMMLAALGACLVKSIRVAAGSEGDSLPSFRICLSGVGATNLPGRVDQITALLDGALLRDVDAEAALLRQAKSICTVSNSLSAKVTLKKEQ